MKIDAVGFDLDYTLAVTNRSRSTILAAATAAVGAPSIGRDEYLDAHRLVTARESREDIFRLILEEKGADVSPERLAAAYRDRINEALTPVPGAGELLAQLRSTYRVGLLTNGPKRAQRSKLKRLGWDSAFDSIVITGELGVAKPDSRAFDELIAQLDTAPERTVFVGDEVDMDIAGAHEAGLTPVQVRYPEGPSPHELAAAQVDRDRLFEEVPAVLDEFQSANPSPRG